MEKPEHDHTMRLAALPGQAWVHIFVSHLVAVAYSMLVGADLVGGELAMFSWAVFGWSAAIAGGVVLAYFILLWLTARSILRTGVAPPPFFMISIPDEPE